MSTSYISLKTDLDDTTTASTMDLTNRSSVAAVAIGNLIGCGARRRFVTVTQGEVDAHGTVTFSSTGPTNTQTMAVNGTTITFVSGTPSGNQVKTNASATVVATELAALLNSSASFTGFLTATSALGVVTVTARAGSGVLGNKIALSAGTASNTAVSGSVLASGANGTITEIPLGLYA